MLLVEHITDEVSFKELEKEWNCLLKNSLSDNIFLTYEWVSTFWDVFKQNNKLFVLTVRDTAKNLIGIAPLKVKLNKVFGIDYRELGFIGDEIVASEYLDFIFLAKKEQVCLEAIFDYLIDANQWDCANLIDMDISAKNIKILQQILEKNEFTFEIYQRNISPYIKLPGSWSEYLDLLSTRSRKDVKRRIRVLAKDYNVQCLFVEENTEELNEFISKYFELQSLRLKDRGISSIVTQPEYKLFHKRVIEMFYKRDWVRLIFLTVDDIYVACIYGYNYNNKFYHYQGGFDPQFSKYSVGMILIAYIIESLIEDGFEEYDFLRGNEEYKFRWTESYRENVGIKIYNKNILGRLVYLMNYYKKLARQKKLFFSRLLSNKTE